MEEEEEEDDLWCWLDLARYLVLRCGAAIEERVSDDEDGALRGINNANNASRS